MKGVSLRNKILLLFLGVIIISSVTTITAVLLATNESVEEHAHEQLNVGRKVFEQLLNIRGRQLFDSAEVLTADFGFKGAVSAGDRETILSVLENHGARIGADLMMLSSLDGSLIASTDIATQQRNLFPFAELLPQAEEDGGLLTVVMLDGKAYQMVMLQVNAPVPVAWASIGFLLDQNLANQLQDLTHLEVTFRGEAKDQKGFSISTMEDARNGAGQSTLLNDEEWQRMSLNDNDYLALLTPLVNTPMYQVSAILRTSLNKAYASFSPLKIQVLLISLVALILSAISAFFIAKNVTRPIHALVMAAKRISGGDYSEDILVGRTSKDEIGELATSFNVMQRGIADREEKILYQVYHDTLTGLPNRILIREEMNKLLQDYQQTEQCFSVICININRFKQVNDTFGYQIGDELLKAFVSRLQSVVKQGATPGRIGADEFLVLHTGTPEPQLPDEINRILSELNTNYMVGEFDISITTCAGVATYPKHGDRADQLLRRADIALNEAKLKKQDVAYYELGADEKYLNQIRLINDLKQAIEQDQLVMFYQPKVDLKQRKVTQVEALIRWFHKELGFISPEEFIGLAEQSGLMPALTRWVIKNVLNEAVVWREQNVNVAMAVNLSAYDLAYDDLPNYVSDLLVQCQLSTESLILEVTESAVMEDPEQALNVLHQFKSSGIKLAIDDYGTGYSSLSQLTSMPVDELKIDMSFVLKLDQSKDDQAIVRSTIEMGHNLGLSIVAEGVENRDSWALLEEYGCDKLQGYYICKPQSSSDFIQWYANYDVLSEYQA
ncbi:putative bifunctional diguanylate cyclase/phosphodiesterase [Litoribacillus peritrichatus]|uniref:EAL domain-containing protein n=1 Tax=Litoribacillus peritrichatus TaxID=718191 RepID=A0ABP7MB09_9GAMM